jgi:hypothetical protein
MMLNPETRTSRLSIFYLLCLTAGVGISISVSRGIGQLRFPADSLYYRTETASSIDALAILVAMVYGVSLTTTFFAWKSGTLWDSPGKTLAFLFSVICVLDWSIQIAASIVMYYRMQGELVAGSPDNRPFITGIWYRNLAPAYGYAMGLPALLVAARKTKSQGLAWRMVWCSFLLFSILIIGQMHFNFEHYVPPSVSGWYFEIALGIPMILMAAAIGWNFIRGTPLDWWTTFTAPLVIATWCAGLILKATSI